MMDRSITIDGTEYIIMAEFVLSGALFQVLYCAATNGNTVRKAD